VEKGKNYIERLPVLSPRRVFPSLCVFCTSETEDVNTSNILYESELELVAERGFDRIELRLNPRTRLYQLKYIGSEDFSPGYASQSYFVRGPHLYMSCPFCGRVQTDPLYCMKDGWRCSDCSNLSSLIKEQRRIIGPKRLTRYRKGDFKALQRDLLSNNSKLNMKALLAMDVLGITSNNLALREKNFKSAWHYTVTWCRIVST